MPRVRQTRCAECSAPATLTRSATRRNRLGFDETTTCWRCEHGHETYLHELDPEQRGTLLQYDRMRLRSESAVAVRGRTSDLLVPLIVDPASEYNPN